VNGAAKTVFCTVLAVATFVLAYIPLRLTVPAALLAAFAMLVASWLAIPRRREAAEIEVAPGITKATLDDALTRIRETASTFERAAQAIADPRVSTAVLDLSRQSRSIADDLAGDPKDLRRAWDFIDYHLAQAARIVASYARLEGSPDKSFEEALRLKSVGNAILEIETLFTSQLRALRADDFAKLSEDVTAMQTIAMRVDSAPLPARAPSVP
jgi:5-bromo-4-chloroindolyl phosphate hydrolysis protein